MYIPLPSCHYVKIFCFYISGLAALQTGIRPDHTRLQGYQAGTQTNERYAGSYAPAV